MSHPNLEVAPCKTTNFYTLIERRVTKQLWQEYVIFSEDI